MAQVHHQRYHSKTNTACQFYCFDTLLSPAQYNITISVYHSISYANSQEDFQWIQKAPGKFHHAFKAIHQLYSPIIIYSSQVYKMYIYTKAFYFEITTKLCKIFQSCTYLKNQTQDYGAPNSAAMNLQIWRHFFESNENLWLSLWAFYEINTIYTLSTI